MVTHSSKEGREVCTQLHQNTSSKEIHLHFTREKFTQSYNTFIVGKKVWRPNKMLQLLKKHWTELVFHPQANHTITQSTDLLETTDTRDKPDTHKPSQMTSFSEKISFTKLNSLSTYRKLQINKMHNKAKQIEQNNHE